MTFSTVVTVADRPGSVLVYRAGASREKKEAEMIFTGMEIFFGFVLGAIVLGIAFNIICAILDAF